MEPHLGMYLPFPKDDPETLGEEFDNPANLEFPQLFNGDLGEPMKKAKCKT